MRKKPLLWIVAVCVAIAFTSSGCIVIKDDRGRHRGYYKQPEKVLKKTK